MTDKKIKIMFIVIPAALLLVVAVVVGVVLLMGGDDGAFRSVQVYRVEGDAEVQKGSGEQMAPYENMILESGDTVKTMENGRLYLKLDDDKYLLAEPGTSFRLVANGTAENSRTRIELSCGTVTVHVTDPLSKDSSFEVGSGNSTMAVRGTSFRVSSVTEDAETTLITVQVFGGVVGVQTANADGSEEQPVDVTAGQEATVTQTATGTSVEVGSDIDMPALDVETLEFLKVGLENGNNVGATAEELDEIIAQKQAVFTVTFVFEGEVFATVRVPYGETAKRPMLMPSPNGEWSFDFTTPITADVTVEWVEQDPE